ncbi:MAG: hypothetical protein ACK42C_05270, partial [Aquificaceae bacterium]
MAVALPFLIILLALETALSYEKKIRENWSKLAYPQKVYQLYGLLGFRCIWYCDGRATENFQTLQSILREVVHLDLTPEITDRLKTLTQSLPQATACSGLHTTSTMVGQDPQNST